MIPVLEREIEFWNFVARKGLPWFRFFRRSTPPAALTERLKGSMLEAEWAALAAALEPGDKIWPFLCHVRSYLGMRQGYVVLRRGKPIGGIVTLLS